MNKKRKILTKIALAAFCVIIVLHYYHPLYNQWTYPEQHHSGRTVTTSKLVSGWSNGSPLIEDIRMPLFVLAVFYAGLFFLFGGKDTDSVPRRPRDWQRIKQVILNISVFAGGLMVIAGIIGAAIESNEYQRQQERARKAYIENEASKHCITVSEIELSDLQMSTGSFNSFINGRIKNNSRQACKLTSVTLRVSVYEKGTANKPWEGVVGEETVKVNVTVPPHQSRAISESIYFKDMPKLEPNRWTWTYIISEIRGSTVAPWLLDYQIGKDFDPDKYLGLTPTPSPKP